MRCDKAGLAIIKPSGWHIIDDASFARWLAKIDGPAFEIEISRGLQDGTALPLACVTRYPADYPDINPTVQVRSIPHRTGMSPVMFLKTELEKTLPRLEAAAMTGAPMATKVAGVEGATARIQYTLHLKDGRQARVETRLLLIPQANRFLQLTGISSLADELRHSEWTAVLEGVEFFDPVVDSDVKP